MLKFISDTTGGKAEYHCECGNAIEAFKSNVARGHTSSCGCLRKRVTSERSTKHGHSAGGMRTKVYVAWKNMRTRCDNEERSDYVNYGGRGIGYVKRWGKFENFLADMGEPPPNTSLDRIDNDIGYSKANCRWALHKVQANNKRSVIRYTYGGKSLTLTEWAKETGIGRLTLRYRIKVGMPLSIALTQKGNLRWQK